MQMSSPKLSWKHPLFCVWKPTLSWWSRKSHSAEPRNNSFIISLCNLKYKRALKFAVWKTSQHYKTLRLQHRDQFIHVIWLHRARKQCTSLQPFMNVLVNVMSFSRNKTSHHQPGRGILDQMEDKLNQNLLTSLCKWSCLLGNGFLTEQFHLSLTEVCIVLKHSSCPLQA